MHPLAKIKTVRILALHSGIKSKDIATQVARLAFQPIQHQFPCAAGTSTGIAYQVVDVQATPFIGILDDPPQGHGNNRLALCHYRHVCAMGNDFTQPGNIVSG